MSQTPRLIDGIVLTKFDTIDDKVSRTVRWYELEVRRVCPWDLILEDRKNFWDLGVLRSRQSAWIVY